MSQVLKRPDVIGELSRTSGTVVTLPLGSYITIGGQQYTNTAALTVTTSVSGAGGIDTGAVASSSAYYVYAVVSANVMVLVASLSASAPTGFTASTKVGSFETDGSSVIGTASVYTIRNVADQFAKRAFDGGSGTIQLSIQTKNTGSTAASLRLKNSNGAFNDVFEITQGGGTVKFRDGVGLQMGQVDTTTGGAWTLGASTGGNLLHVLQAGGGVNVRLSSGSATVGPQLGLFRQGAGTQDALIATSGAADQYVTGSLAGDLLIGPVGGARRIIFTPDFGSTIGARMSGLGTWVLGSNNTAGVITGTHIAQNGSLAEAALQVQMHNTNAATTGVQALTVVKGSNDSTTAQKFVVFVMNAGNTNSGQINANGASSAAFGTFSDSRLKENIEDLPSQLSNVMALRPVEFDYLDGSGHQIGFIAQEMQTVYPDSVSADSSEDAILSITGWDKTSARLVKAMQELKLENDELKARVEALENP